MPTVTRTIPQTTKYSYKKGDIHLGVWAIQRAFNEMGIDELDEDGVFGDGTELAVKKWQWGSGLVSDGIFGPASQARLVVGLEKRLRVILPPGLIRSQVEGESGNFIAAVNWSVAGGVDCGYVQRRVYADGGYTQAEIEDAFDALVQFNLLGSTLRERKDSYVSRPVVAARGDKNEYAWRLAALHHNWPWAAQQLAGGFALPTTPASWVPAGCHFDDGAPVVTQAQWAQFYSMGSVAHNHKGQMVKYVTNWIA